MPGPTPPPPSSGASAPSPKSDGTAAAMTSSQHEGMATAAAVDAAQVERPRSVQFAADARLGHPPSLLAEKKQAARSSGLRRVPSPPPPSAYSRGVSFDTFPNRDATDFALTLNYKHKDYRCTRRSRTFLCCIDQNDYSELALEWLVDELVDDGDEIVCLRVVEKDSKIASESSVEEGRYRQEAEKLLESAVAKNSTDEKAINLIMEFAVGKVEDIIQRMIQIYEPAVLVVGTRGRSLGGVQGLLPGSVSKYCLQQSPIPVIVVRPSPKREKKKKKRMADPSRKSYNHILRMSEASGNKLFEPAESTNSSSTKLPEDEAAAVAKAVGLASSSQSDLPSRPVSKDSSSPKGASDSEDEGTAKRTSTSSTLFNPTSPTSDSSSVAVASPTLEPTGSDGDCEESDNDRKEPRAADDNGSVAVSPNSSDPSIASGQPSAAVEGEQTSQAPAQEEKTREGT